MYCPNCGQENPAEARFCAACGSMLEAAGSATGAPPETLPITTFEYAGFWMRFGAWLIDLVIVGIGSAILSSLLGFAFGLDYLFSLIRPVLLALYYVLFTGLRGQTPGKMALGIKVVREDGQLPGLRYAALREVVGKIVSTIALFLGFLWIVWDSRKRGWHDYIAGTTVVKVRGRISTTGRISPNDMPPEQEGTDALH